MELPWKKESTPEGSFGQPVITAVVTAVNFGMSIIPTPCSATMAEKHGRQASLFLQWEQARQPLPSCRTERFITTRGGTNQPTGAIRECGTLPKATTAAKHGKTYRLAMCCPTAHSTPITD